MGKGRRGALARERDGTVMGDIVLLTDLSSDEGSRAMLATAVEDLTGVAPISIDARHFMTGGSGQATLDRRGVALRVDREGLFVRPAIVLIYEIPPAARRGFEPFQQRLRACGAVSLGTDAAAWQAATEKNLTARRFARARIPQMDTISLSDPGTARAIDAFETLGCDVWARPTVGAGGNDVFHITTLEALEAARQHYANRRENWLIARDAGNFNADRCRHQYRIVVLGDRVLRVCEHVQADPEAPCNESQGAISTLLEVDGAPPDLLRLAVSATRALGLPFGGVDLAPTASGGVVFEVNVHPVLSPTRGLEDVAVPYVQAHLDLLCDRSRPAPRVRRETIPSR